MGFPTKNGGKKGGHSTWPPLFSSPQPEQSVEDRGALLLWPAEGGEVEAPISIRCVRLLHRRGHNIPWAQLFGELRGCLAGCASCGSASLALWFPLSCEEEACCVSSSSIFRGLLSVVVLCNGIWCRVVHRGDLHGEGPSP
ncbi:hypothetical protein Taro_005481 [Colocasia esculenta]|uniref:Uncharacterized protein n=1 Tax=Colocasia esculenta TaxID=4460 RepID=A0A843TL32_COLES|nr:hypothetical protein [Colocasia esculenta]